MAIFRQVQDALQFVLEGASRIFAPDRDEYPETGMQPYDGDPYDERHTVD
ncbi:MAG: isochorismate synthase [Cyanobacteria bacterium P01_E01_bin.6]